MASPNLHCARSNRRPQSRQKRSDRAVSAAPLFELSQGQSARETAPTIGASLASNVKKENEL